MGFVDRLLYNDTKPVDIPPNISTWTWNATAPSGEGSYSVTVKAYDHFCGVWVEGGANFTVTAEQNQLPPEITKVETLREGDLVFFRLFYTDPNNDAMGFGFRGANGAGWAETTFPFSSPSYGRWSPAKIEYPFNHLCGTGSEYESDVEAWIYDSTGLRSPSATVHLACLSDFRNEILNRARSWVKANVPYNQKNYRDGYRTNCSGFVSYAWQLKNKGQPISPDTESLGSTYGIDISFDTLRPGDIINNKRRGNDG